MSNYIVTKLTGNGISVTTYTNDELFNADVAILTSDQLVNPTIPDINFKYLTINEGVVSLVDNQDYKDYLIRTKLNPLYALKREYTDRNIVDIVLSNGTHSFEFNTVKELQDFRDRRDASKTSNTSKKWKTLDGAYISFTPSDFDEVFLAIENQADAVFLAYQADKDDINNGIYTMDNLNAI
jgi:hypothetical protein